MEHRFQVDLRGIIEILSEHLYSGPQVFLRELLQNAVDAITARQKLDQDFSPEVWLEISKSEDGVPVLIFSDNGVGLLESEVHQFLATIGKSSKREVGSKDGRTSDFIGQFGIGLLSGMLGIGGGVILSPILLILGWATLKETASISSLFIFVNSSQNCFTISSSFRMLFRNFL